MVFPMRQRRFRARWQFPWAGAAVAATLLRASEAVAQTAPAMPATRGPAAVNAERPPRPVAPREREKQLGCSYQQWFDFGLGPLVTPGVELETRARFGTRLAMSFGNCDGGAYVAAHVGPGENEPLRRRWFYLELGGRVRVLGPSDDHRGARLFATFGATWGELEAWPWPVSLRLAPRAEYRFSPRFMVWGELGALVSIRHLSGDVTVGVAVNGIGWL